VAMGSPRSNGKLQMDRKATNRHLISPTKTGAGMLRSLNPVSRRSAAAPERSKRVVVEAHTHPTRASNSPYPLPTPLAHQHPPPSRLPVNSMPITTTSTVPPPHHNQICFTRVAFEGEPPT
jgi:hypothetical protein